MCFDFFMKLRLRFHKVRKLVFGTPFWLCLLQWVVLHCLATLKSSEVHVRSTVPLCGERDPYVSAEDLFLKIDVFSFIVLNICNTGTEVSILKYFS